MEHKINWDKINKGLKIIKEIDKLIQKIDKVIDVEMWRPLIDIHPFYQRIGFENFYTPSEIKHLTGIDNDEVSSHGRYRNKYTHYDHTQRYQIMHAGYIKHDVAHAFLPNPLKLCHIDYIDGDPTNNHVKNLRWITRSVVSQNQAKKNGTSSKYKGVSWHQRDKKWRAGIRHNGKSIHIGYFKDEKDAGRAYNAKAKEVFGEFAKLNTIN